jgi:hypothetical protein
MSEIEKIKKDLLSKNLTFLRRYYHIFFKKFDFINYFTNSKDAPLLYSSDENFEYQFSFFIKEHNLLFDNIASKKNKDIKTTFITTFDKVNKRRVSAESLSEYDDIILLLKKNGFKNIFQIWRVVKKLPFKNSFIIIRNDNYLFQINSFFNLIKLLVRKKYLRLILRNGTIIIRLSNNNIYSVFNDYIRIIKDHFKQKVKFDNFVILGKPDVYIFKFYVQGKYFIARIPLDDFSENRLNIAKSNLAGLQKYNLPRRFLFPVIKHILPCGTDSIYIETFLKGKLKKPSHKAKKKIVETIAKIQYETAKQSTSEKLIKYINDNMIHFDENIAEKYRLILKRIINKISEELNNKNITYVFEHGDLKIENVLFNNSQHIGLLDWDISRLEGTPIVDFIFFEYYNRVLNGATSLSGFISFLIEDNGFKKIFMQNGIYKDYMERMFEFSQLIYIFLFWYHHVTVRHHFPSTYHPEWQEEHICKPLEIFEKYYVS